MNKFAGGQKKQFTFLDQISDVQTIKHLEEYSSSAKTTVLCFMTKRITSMHPGRSKSRSFQ